MELTQNQINQLGVYCYLTNNRFAYKFERDKKIPEDEMKYFNFVPTYDKWCLFCDRKGCTSICSKCKYVYFCDQKCQRKSWKIHKTHCNRDLFGLCIACGSNNIKIKCPTEKCKINYCSETCKNSIHEMHLLYDCNNLINLQ